MGPLASAKWPIFSFSKPKLLGGNQRSSAEAAILVALGDIGDCEGLVVACMPGLSELSHTQCNNLLHCLAGRLHVVARVKLLRALPQNFTNRAGDRQTVVRIDVDFANAVADTKLNLFDRHTPGLLQLAAVLVHNVLQIFWHG